MNVDLWPKQLFIHTVKSRVVLPMWNTCRYFTVHSCVASKPGLTWDLSLSGISLDFRTPVPILLLLIPLLDSVSKSENTELAGS